MCTWRRFVACRYDISLPLERYYEPVKLFREKYMAELAVEVPEVKIYMCCGYGHVGDGNIHFTVVADGPFSQKLKVSLVSCPRAVCCSVPLIRSLLVLAFEHLFTSQVLGDQIGSDRIRSRTRSSHSFFRWFSCFSAVLSLNSLILIVFVHIGCIHVTILYS